MAHSRRELVTGVVSLALVGLAGCAGGDETPTDTPTDSAPQTPTLTPTESPEPAPTSESVAIEGSTFEPIRLSVPVGTRVEWTNEDSYAHDVTSAQLTDQGAAWDYYSGSFGGGETAEYIFDAAGAYEYYCSIHGRSLMCGVVVVGDASHDATLPCE